MKISDIILNKIKEIQDKKPKQKFDWNDSLYEDIKFLSIDERGDVGEEITAEILKKFGCSIDYDQSVTNDLKGWDIISNGLRIEVKTATVTVGTGLFQHEHLHPKRNFDAVLFLDITPNEVYLTAVLKNDILWKKIHRRENGDYKCDFTIKQIKENNISKFSKYAAGIVFSDKDFFNIYKSIENNK